jgi:hypothetical protein
MSSCGSIRTTPPGRSSSVSEQSAKGCRGGSLKTAARHLT